MYSDLEFNDNIKNIKHIFYKYSTLYKNIRNIILNTNDKFMPRIYKDTKEYEYEIREDELDLFYSKGGTFTEEELKHIKFSRLFDKKFVLNEN